MKQERIELVNYRIEKAKNTLSDAKNYFTSVTLESTVNRIYYSMFYAVNALLISKGLSSSKHSGIRSLFNKEFVKNGLVETRLGKFYSDMFDRRQEGDYKDIVTFQKCDVEMWIRDAGEFIDKIEKLISEIIHRSPKPQPNN